VWKKEVATNSVMVTSVIVSCDNKNGIGSEQGKNRGHICISHSTGLLIEMFLFLQQEQYL